MQAKMLLSAKTNPSFWCSHLSAACPLVPSEVCLNEVEKSVPFLYKNEEF